MQHDEDGGRLADTEAICLRHRFPPAIPHHRLQQYRAVEDRPLLVDLPQGRQVRKYRNY